MFSWKLQQVTIPLKFTATVYHLVAVLMCLDGIESNLKASLRPGHSQSSYDTIESSGTWALYMSLLCIFFCIAGSFAGYTLTHPVATFFQIPLHVTALVLLLVVHYQSLHYIRFWHIFFSCALPAAVLEVVIFSHIKTSKKISW